MWKIMMVILMLICIMILAGCQSEQRPVWGKGDPDANWQRYFGNGNLARLNSNQTQKINLHGKTLAALIDRVSKLEAEVIGPNSLAARFDVLEATVITDDVNETVTHCNEDSGCGWAYWKCSLHSRTSVKPKPYIYENLIKIDPDPDPHPNTIRITPDELGTVCTKHGRLQWGERYVFPGDANKQYCINCVGDVLRLYLDKHIGRDPNSADSGY